MPPKRKSRVVKTSNDDLVSLNDLLVTNIRMGAQHETLSNNTINMYKRQLIQIYKAGLEEFKWSPTEFMDHIQNIRRYPNEEFERIYKEKKSDIIGILFSLYTAKESLITSLNALCKVTKGRFLEAFQYYVKIRKELSMQNKAEKLDNELTPDQAEKYISYKELMAIPENLKHGIVDKYGSLFLSKAKFDKIIKKSDKNAYLKLVFDYVTLFLNVHHPIRLVWPTVELVPSENGNYLEGNKLHLNAFKNVRLIGPQVLKLDEKTMAVIRGYLKFMSGTLGIQPTRLLYRMNNHSPTPYTYTTENASGFSSVISNLFKAYNGKPISMNIIRHIVESHIIQSPEYARMTNKQKQDLHSKLLHSSMAANLSYNKIINRPVSKETTPEPEVDNSFDFELPEPPSTPRRPEKQRGRRERVFRGDFTPAGSDRHLEIEIFQS